ncbi:hypothetical protein CABS01_01844 [Colletotrichum abscissum]|uniref:Btz domain-containing protein n=1 Tax=Colletotrichum abscissum TaxID=1671311 RepID=A0A9P9X5W4_9PEZI|nr:uncharacterized protein CABS01_01844 [Colletotrichum abscissum]KAI3538191.1 hypothetical protein CABS02_11835 [Colletotrichum abscissum]KAK1496037.1 hypothetical protein CABS01_01844 [Colletotrichum abscissum]
MAAPRRRKIGHRRRIEDEEDGEGGPDQLELDDDSLTEGSIISDDHDHGNDSDTSNIDEASPVTPNPRKSAGNGNAKSGSRKHSALAPSTTNKAAPDAEELSVNDRSEPVQPEAQLDGTASPPKSSAPLVVSSHTSRPAEPVNERRRREHEEYKRRRDEDPAFVPNRGAFFMHDHRHAGPSANGFRPFGRGRGRGGRGGGIGGPYAPIKYAAQQDSARIPANPRSQLHSPTDPLTSGQWAHDMHEAVTEPPPSRHPRHLPVETEGPANGNGFIPTCPSNPTPINRTLSTERHIGNVQVRVSLPVVGKAPAAFGMPVKQYTKLPDHRPPLRRDKPVRISLPDNPPKYIFPAVDRSFIFIPRAMRPNQQRTRGKPRSGLGSMGGFSRRTSVFGGSYYGSAYSPSIALSRRSSLAPDGRDYLFSPTGSVMSRAPIPVENPRPVVRLPPAAHPNQPFVGQDGYPMQPNETSINDLPQPQTHPLPQKPAFQESRPNSIPMHQPRPQKAVSVTNIESPTLNQGPQAFQQAFHQQVPLQVSNGMPQEAHSRQPSYPTQHSTGTPLSQIPERAIHAAPFQPNTFQQQQNFYNQPYPMMQPQQPYYYPGQYNGNNMGPSAAAPSFVPSGQPGQGQGFPPQAQADPAAAQANGQGPPGPNLVAQEVNGMVYYYDATQMSNYQQSYQPPPQFGPGVSGMGGMVTPSPDAFYYQQPAPGMVYYSQ